MPTEPKIRVDATRAVDLAGWALECGLDRDVLLGDFPPVFKASITKRGLDEFQQLIRDVQQLSSLSSLVNYDGHPYLTWLAIAHRQSSMLGHPRAVDFERILYEVLDTARRQAATASPDFAPEVIRLGRSAARHAASAEAADGVFISYRSSDRPAVRALYGQLVQRVGADRVFFDAETIQPGDHWFTQIKGGLMRAQVLVLWVTSAYLTSQWGAFEVGVAQERGALVIPIFVDDGVDAPQFITEHQGLILRDIGVERVASVVAERLGVGRSVDDG